MYSNRDEVTFDEAIAKQVQNYLWHYFADFIEAAEGDEYDKAVSYLALAYAEWNAGL